MVELSGLTIKNDKNPYGDILIKIIGLRPGEKLYEELLIGDNPKKTSHHKIQKTNEEHISFEKLERFSKLRNWSNQYNAYEVKKLLSSLLKSYKSNSDIVDHVHIEQSFHTKYHEKLISISQKIKKYLI